MLCAQAGPRDQPPSLHQVGLTVANLGSSPGAPRAYPPLHPVAGLPTMAAPCEARARSGGDLSASDRCGQGCVHMLYAHAVCHSGLTHPIMAAPQDILSTPSWL